MLDRTRPEPIWPGAPRACPGAPLPARVHLPGITPPPADAGSEELPIGPAGPLPPQLWRFDRAWLYGVDLYHAGYLYEAHEAFEAVWRGALADSDQGRTARAAAQIAGAALLTRLGREAAGRRLAARAAGHLATVAAGPSIQHDGRFMGLTPSDLAAELARYDAARPPRLALARRSAPD